MSSVAVFTLLTVALMLALCHSQAPHAPANDVVGRVIQDKVGSGVEMVVEGSDGSAVLSDEELEYQRGSVCRYCDHCKYCPMCARDCPCETGPGKPNCHMCKYCRYCYLCSVCDSSCQPGGVVDWVTATIISALPKINTEEIEADLRGVKNWIERKRDEL